MNAGSILDVQDYVSIPDNDDAGVLFYTLTRLILNQMMTTLINVYSR